MVFARAHTQTDWRERLIKNRIRLRRKSFCNSLATNPAGFFFFRRNIAQSADFASSRTKHTPYFYYTPYASRIVKYRIASAYVLWSKFERADFRKRFFLFLFIKTLDTTVCYDNYIEKRKTIINEIKWHWITKPDWLKKEIMERMTGLEREEKIDWESKYSETLMKYYITRENSIGIKTKYEQHYNTFTNLNKLYFFKNKTENVV